MGVVDKLISFLEEKIGTLCLVLMLLVVLYSVFMRYIMNSPIAIGEELSRYLMIWATYLGVSLGVKRNAHLGITFIADSMPIRISKVIRFVASLINLIVYIVLFMLSCSFVLKSIATGQHTPALQIPFYIVYFSLVVGFFLSSIRTVQNIWYDYKGNGADKHRYEEVHL